MKRLYERAHKLFAIVFAQTRQTLYTGAHCAY
jgi:hypothetical protein